MDGWKEAAHQKAERLDKLRVEYEKLRGNYYDVLENRRYQVEARRKDKAFAFWLQTVQSTIIGVLGGMLFSGCCCP